MKAVKTPWNGLSKALLLFAIPFTLIGLVMVFDQGRSPVFLINGMIWTMISVILRIKGALNQHKLQNIKKSGYCYDGSIVNIVPAQGVRLGSYVTACVECNYKTEKGTCLIRSGYYLIAPFIQKKDLLAKIYFDYNDSKKYAIELFERDYTDSLET